MHATTPAVAAVFEPVQTVTTFEETVERLGTAIRLGLLPPGAQLPPERDLAEQMGISRSTLRQSLTALTQSGHLVAVRGRGGGWFVADPLPPAQSEPVELSEWRELLDYRVAIEVGAVVLAAERAGAHEIAQLRRQVERMREVGDFPTFRQADVFFHLGLAEAAGSSRLVAAMTEVQGAMSELIGHIAHPPEVLDRSNLQHAKLIALLERGDAERAARLIRDHVHGTERVLAGLMP
jgi:GntR family transcriptional regulator, transcriptional repressor for pyruvate dehydrogenase complex